MTLPAHASILTGRTPRGHGVHNNVSFRLSDGVPTLATVLKAAGYRTGAFVGAFVLDARFGLNRGFDIYDDRYGEKHAGDDTDGAERRAEDVIKPATRWIVDGTESSPAATPRPRESDTKASAATEGYDRAPRREGVGERGWGPATDKKWFAWVHLYDPHEPYRAPEPYASQHAAYDAEVAYTDAMIGRMLAEIDAAHHLDRTLVIVAADHGESLGEHGERSHGVFAYDATLRVPWLVWAGPRIGAHRFDAPARLIDLAPTLLDLIGVQPPQSFEGRSLLQAVNARETSGP